MRKGRKKEEKAVGKSDLQGGKRKKAKKKHGQQHGEQRVFRAATLSLLFAVCVCVRTVMHVVIIVFIRNRTICSDLGE